MLNIKVNNISRLFSGYSTNYILETELKSPEQTVDISICILKKDVGSLLEHWRKDNIIGLFSRDRGWTRLSKFCFAWKDSVSSLSKYVTDVWFEFDNHQLDKDLPGACFFFSPRNLHKRIGSDSVRIDWLFDEALSILSNESLSVKSKENVIKCIESLPENGIVFQIGVMMAREVNRLRVCTSMPIDFYVSYLEEIGWKGSCDFLDKILNSLKRYVDGVFIDMDVGEEISPEVGVQCCFRGVIDIRMRLKKFLLYLMEQGLCTKKKADDICSWIENSGKSNINLSPLEINLKKTLSHIKIVISPNNLLKAKAYLSLSGGGI